MKQITATPTSQCWCGCGGTTSPGRFFIHPGHDQKARSALEAHYKTSRGNDGLANLLASLGFDATPRGNVQVKKTNGRLATAEEHSRTPEEQMAYLEAKLLGVQHVVALTISVFSRRNIQTIESFTATLQSVVATISKDLPNERRVGFADALNDIADMLGRETES